MKNIRVFHLKIFSLVTFSIYLNRRVFVMRYWDRQACANLVYLDQSPQNVAFDQSTLFATHPVLFYIHQYVVKGCLSCHRISTRRKYSSSGYLS